MNCPFFKMASVAVLAAALTVTGCKKDKQEAGTQSSTPALAVNISRIDNGTSELEQTVSLTSNAKWTATVADAAAAWLRVDKTSGENNATLKITVKANTGHDARSGNIVFKAEGTADVNIAVSQKGLIEWHKGISNNINRKVFELEDGYVIAGERNGYMYIYKVNKTTMEVIKSDAIEIAGYPRSSFVDLEPLPGGGFIGTGYLNQTTTGVVTDVYVFELNNNLERVKGKVIDFGTINDFPYAIHKLDAGYVLGFYTGGSTYLTKLNEHLDEVDGTRKITSMGNMTDIKTTSTNEVIVTGHSDGYFSVAKHRNDLSRKSIYKQTFFGLATAAWVTADDKVAVTGQKNVADGIDIYAVKLDANHNIITGQEFSINKGRFDYANCIIGLKDGGYAISGLVTIDGETQGYSLQVDNNLYSKPGKELFLNYVDGIEASYPLSDGGYLVTGTGRNPSDLWSNLIRINP